jgi:hypothetical protein
MNTLDYRQAHQQIGRWGWRRFFFRAHLIAFLLGLFLFFFWLRALPFGYPPYLIPPALWGLLLIAHWFYKATADAQDAVMERLLDNLYAAPNARYANAESETYPPDLPSYEHLRQMVEAELTREKVKRRRFLFRINVAAYLVIMLLGWILIPIMFGPFLTESSALTIFALSFGGLVQVILHYLAIRLDNAEGETALRERLLGRALQNMTEGDERMADKAKRIVRLSEDGELLDIVDEGQDRRSFLNQE